MNVLSAAAIVAMLTTTSQADETSYYLPSPLIFEPVDPTEQLLKDGQLPYDFVEYCKQYPDDCRD